MTREQYLLTVLAEECNEVAQRCTKAIRFGAEEVEEGQGNNNRDRIEFEIIDMLGVIEMLMASGTLSVATLSLELNRDDINAKKAKVERYMEYSKSLGVLD